MLNPWIILFWLATLATSALGGWVMRGDNEAAKRLDEIAQAQEKTEIVQAAVDQLDGQQSAINAEQVVKDRIITREVIRYVEITPAEQRCDLPGTWRVRHDAAATGQPTESAGLADRAAEPVTDAAALEAVAENYTACRAYIQQVSGWQAWWETVKGACRG